MPLIGLTDTQYQALRNVLGDAISVNERKIERLEKIGSIYEAMAYKLALLQENKILREIVLSLYRARKEEEKKVEVVDDEVCTLPIKRTRGKGKRKERKLPEPEILRLEDVINMTGLNSREQVDRLIEQGMFPRKIALGKRAVGWRTADIKAWIATRQKV